MYYRSARVTSYGVRFTRRKSYELHFLNHLSPTFHRAFDRGIISISDNYRVLIHPKLKDYHPETGIKQYANNEIILPNDSRFYPSVNSLQEHRRKFGFV